jgi:hypothetical protein
MRLPFQRAKVPVDVRSLLDLHPGERVLAADRDESGGYLVTTDRAVHVLPAAEPGGPPVEAVRLRWDLVDLATWNPPLLMLEVRRGADDPVQRLVIALEPRSGLPAVVRDRVTGSIVVNERHEAGSGWFRILARRNSDSGALEWRVQPGPGVNPRDPAVASAIESQLQRIRGQWEV